MIRRVWGRKGVRVHAPYATRYKWGYLHEALEVDGARACELVLTPAIDQDIHAIFLKQIADSDYTALHVVIADQAGFHLPEDDVRLPANLRLLPPPALGRPRPPFPPSFTLGWPRKQILALQPKV